ncbi:9568_t:CDS:2, partial [Gigaspora margarita]
MGGGGIHVIKKSLYFGNIQVNKEECDCLRIKICKFTDPSLTSIKHNEVDFIGCSMYRIGNQWHHYIKVDSEKVNIVLLRDLFLGKEEIQEELPYCTTLLHRSSKRKKSKSILNAPSQEVVESILDKIESLDKPVAK